MSDRKELLDYTLAIYLKRCNALTGLTYKDAVEQAQSLLAAVDGAGEPKPHEWQPETEATPEQRVSLALVIPEVRALVEAARALRIVLYGIGSLPLEVVAAHEVLGERLTPFEEPGE